MMLPLFAELCAGTAALSLRLHGGKNARPPVSRMGNKQGYSSAILRTLGLRSGSGAARYLWCEPDDGCRLLLTSYTDAELRAKAAEIIRSWKDEDPRALWERLRAEGPVKAPPVDPREVARWCYMAARNLGSGPIGANYVPEENPHPDWGGRGASRVCIANRLPTLPTLPATIAPDARAVDPREVARWIRLVTANRLINVGPDFQNTGQGGSTHGGDAFCTSIPELLDAMDRVPVDPLPAAIAPDARAVCPPANLPPGSVVYIDPPYVNTTGYAHDLGRDAVCELAERWASAGAWVVISEAEPLAELGWHHVEITGERVGQKRTFSKQQREYLTMSQPPRWRPSVQHTLFSMAAK